MRALTAVMCLLCTSTFAQQAVISNVTQEGTDIVIEYSITPDESQEERYRIAVYSSVDDYSRPVPIKSGQTTDITPSASWKVVIDGPSNFSGFRGNLNFQIGTEITYVPLIARAAQPSIKRGSSLRFNFSGLENNERYTIELYSGNERVQEISYNFSSDTYNWRVDEKQSVGTHRIRISDSSGKEAYSGSFAIKRKIPLGYKILPVAVAGGVAGIILLMDKPIKSDDLPFPVDPPE